MVQAKPHTKSQPHAMLENACVLLAIAGGGFALAASFNLFGQRSASVAGLSTGMAALSGVVVRELNRKDSLQEMTEKLERTKKAVELATNLEVERNHLRQHIGQLQTNLDQLQNALAEKSQAYVIESAERQKLLSVHAELIELQQKYKAVDAEFAQEAIDHELLKQEHQKLTQELQTTRTRIEQLAGQNEALILANHRFEAEKATFEKIAHLEASVEVGELRKKLDEWTKSFDALEGHFTSTKNLYNSLLSDNQHQRDYYVAEFTELQKAASEEIPQLIEGVLDERDQRILTLMQERDELSTELAKPRKFDAIGEYARADVLIDELLKQNDPLVLDAVDIDHSESHQFKAYYWLRHHSGGTLVAKALNELSESLMVPCRCIKPIRFDCDPLNPHRISALFVHHKVERSKATIAKDWKTADQFVAIAGKWSRIRVTGGSESGKSPVAEMIAGAIQQNRPTAQIVLAFPKQNSRKNHWTIPVIYTGWDGCLQAAKDANATMEARDKGEDQSDFFYAPIIDEVDTTLAKYPEVANEIKAVLKSGSHNDVGIILLGQNANVKQWSGYDRSDFESVVNVHIGSNAKHAINNSGLSASEKKELLERFDRIVDYCEKENEDIGSEDMKLRFALVFEPNKSAFFIELPRFGAVTYNNLLSVQVKQEPKHQAKKVTEIACPECGSMNHKKDGTNRQKTIQFHKCRDCGKRFPRTL